MYLREEGLNVDDPLNSELLAVENQLSAFARRHNNSLPDTDEYNSMLDIAVDAFEKIKIHTGLDEKLVSSVLVSIASACVLVLQSDAHVRQWDESRPTDYNKIKEIILYCISMHTDSDIYAEENYSPGSIFTSTPVLCTCRSVDRC